MAPRPGKYLKTTSGTLNGPATAYEKAKEKGRIPKPCKGLADTSPPLWFLRLCRGT